MRQLGADAAAALDPDVGYVIAAAVRPSGDAFDYSMRTRTSTNPYVEHDRGPFCPSGTLSAALAPGATSATIANLVDQDLVEIGSFAQIGTELVRVDAWDENSGAITIGRGVLGTVAKAHSSGTRIYFRDRFTAVDPTQWVDGETVDVKMLTRTGLGQLAEGSAPSNAVTLDQRAARPYPPGRMRIAATAYPAQLIQQVAAVTWSHRDRLTQNLQGDESTDIGPEVGTTYSIEVRNADTNALIDSATGITGTSHAAPAVHGAFNMRVQLWSVRGGLDSAQRHDFTFWYSYGAPPATLTATASLIAGTATGS